MNADAIGSDAVNYYERMDDLQQAIIDACNEGDDAEFWHSIVDHADLAAAVVLMLKLHANGETDCVTRFKEMMFLHIKRYAEQRIKTIGPTVTMGELERKLA